MTLALSACRYSDMNCRHLRASLSMQDSAITYQDCNFFAKPENFDFSLLLRSDSGDDNWLKCRKRAGKFLRSALTDVKDENTHLTLNTFWTQLRTQQQLDQFHADS